MANEIVLTVVGWMRKSPKPSSSYLSTGTKNQRDMKNDKKLGKFEKNEKVYVRLSVFAP